MDYFCYISQNKVDQLCANFEKAETLEWSEQAGKTAEKKASGGLSSIFGILKADISYGRSDMFQRNEKLKRTTVQKLKDVVHHYINEIEMFSWDLARHTPGHFYFIKAPFVVDNIDEASLIATLVTKNNRTSLFLDCSLKYFSDEPVREGKIFLTSTNSRFFSTKPRMEITFESVFLITHATADTWYGSPLYLKLAPIPGVVL